MPQPLKSLPESRFVQALESIFKKKGVADTAIDYLERFESEAGLRLPFAARRLRVVYETFSVYGDLLRFTPRCSLMQYATETPDSPMLLLDSQLPGKEGLFFAQWMADRDMISTWVNRMTNVSVYANSRGPEAIIMAPVSAFLPV